MMTVLFRLQSLTDPFSALTLILMILNIPLYLFPPEPHSERATAILPKAVKKLVPVGLPYGEVRSNSYYYANHDINETVVECRS